MTTFAINDDYNTACKLGIHLKSPDIHLKLCWVHIKETMLQIKGSLLPDRVCKYVLNTSMRILFIHQIIKYFLWKLSFYLDTAQFGFMRKFLLLVLGHLTLMIWVKLSENGRLSVEAKYSFKAKWNGVKYGDNTSNTNVTTSTERQSIMA